MAGEVSHQKHGSLRVDEPSLLSPTPGGPTAYYLQVTIFRARETIYAEQKERQGAHCTLSPMLRDLGVG